MLVWLEWFTGEQVPIYEHCVFGRSADCNLLIKDPKVSRRHALIHQQGDECWLIDLGSANGTKVNGRRLCQPCRLHDRDQIEIAGLTFTFHDKRPSANTAGFLPQTVREIRSFDCWLLVADLVRSTQLQQRLTEEEAASLTGRWLSECQTI